MAANLSNTGGITFPWMYATLRETVEGVRAKAIGTKESAQIFGGVRVITQTMNTQMRMMQMAGYAPDDLLEMLPQTKANPEQKKGLRKGGEEKGETSGQEASEPSA